LCRCRCGCSVQYVPVRQCSCTLSDATRQLRVTVLLCYNYTVQYSGFRIFFPIHQAVDMCWPLVAEEPHKSTILNLGHCPLKANVSCLIFPLHQEKISSTQPLSGLDSPSQGSRGQLTSTPPYRSPPSLFPFKIGKATRAHPALALLSPYLP
jgi:hypothetical protein